MLVTCIKIEVVEELSTKTVLWKHAFDSHPYEFGRLLCKDLLRGAETLSTWLTGVTNVHLVGHLLTSESHLVRVEDDDIVTTVHVRSE